MSQPKPDFIAHTCISRSTAHTFWLKLPHAGGFWGDYAGTEEEDFIKLLVNSKLLVETSFGLIRIDYYHFGGSANIHAVFWSAEALRANAAFDAILEWLHTYLRVSRVTITIPARSRSLRRLLLSIGFSKFQTAPKYYSTSRGCFDGILYARMA